MRLPSSRAIKLIRDGFEVAVEIPSHTTALPIGDVVYLPNGQRQERWADGE